MAEARDPAPAPAPPYRVFRPSTFRSALPLVVVHGAGRAAGAAFRSFLPVAARAGIPLIVPRFSAGRYPQYQQLAGPDGPWSAADAFEAVLADAALRYGLQTGTIGLLGFSGGAQFAHRYALVAPARVERLIVAAAGWYSYLDDAAPFPVGIAVAADADRRPDPAGFLEIPTLVVVGEDDTETGGRLRHSSQLDAVQGRDRVTRALRWADHLEAQARLRGQTARTSFALLPATGHSLSEAVERGGLGDLAVTALTRELDR